MTEEKRRMGRPRKYLNGNGDGAPKMTIRMDEDLMAYVRARGGQEFVRRLVVDHRMREEEKSDVRSCYGI